MIELEIKIAPKVRVQLRFWDELKEVRVKPHLKDHKSNSITKARFLLEVQDHTLSRVTGSKNGEMPL